MTHQNEDKETMIGTIQSTPVEDEQAKARPVKGELPDKELEEATGGSGRPEPPEAC
jgi:hypothetical protein